MSAVDGLRTLRADNPGPFTLDGTRTRLIGRDHLIVVDPGPDMDSHVRALSHHLDAAERVTMALTHGHEDHAGAVDALLGLHSDVEVVGSGHRQARPLHEGDRIPSDAGELIAILTPGHTRDHLAFHWPSRRILFAGDLVLGEGDTTWVAEYPGCVADYLASLDRCEMLELDRIISAHGPDLTEPADVWRRYRRHRLERIERVRAAHAAAPGADVDELMARVYGASVPEGLESAARASLLALLHHLGVSDEEEDRDTSDLSGS